MKPLHYVRMVLWSFFGIRRRAGAEEELSKAKLVPLLLAAIFLAACFAALLICLALTASSAFAAPPAHRVPDTMAQRMQACVACHGEEGRATNEGYFPRIAGKPAGYLYNQLLNFRGGQRGNPAMAHLTSHLSDEYLREIAEYFAALELPYPAARAANISPAVLARGEQLVKQGDAARGLPACVQCHGAAMTGVSPAMPGLLGLPRDYLVGQLGAWQTGLRKAAAPDCMAQLARKLSSEDITAVSSWLASQPVAVHAKPAAWVPGRLPIECGSHRP